MLNRSCALERLVLALIPLLVVWGIWAFGIWDPWELDAAEGARGATETERERPILRSWLIGVAFETLGVHEWSGRLPGVLAGLLTCGLALWLVGRYQGRRAGVIAAVIVATTPIFLLNARLMMGDGLGFFAQAWVAAAAFSVCVRKRGYGPLWIGYGLLAVGIAFSTLASGVLLGPLPPILAVAVVNLLNTSSAAGSGNPLGRSLVIGVGAIMVAGVVRAVSLDAVELSLWLGGGAVGGNPPTFEKAFEVVFHGFAPWSAALPVAIAWALAPRPSRDASAQSLAWMMLLWASFAYVSWTVFASRYGTPPYLALVPLAGVVAIWMSEVTEEAVSRWPSTVVIVLLFGLLIRDYALYPDSALRGLAVDDLRVPVVTNPGATWTFAFGLMAALFAFMLVSHEASPRPKPHRTRQWLAEQWATGPVQQGWLMLGALITSACVVFGLLSLMFDLRLASVVIRVGKALFFLPLILAVLVWALPWLQYAYGRLRNGRGFPVLAGAAAIAAYIALSFQPALSQHFSPKPVYEAYQELTAGRPDPLVTYRVPSTAARYYTNTRTEELDQQADLIGYLQEPGQRWAVIPAEHLPDLDRAYRRKVGGHLYVADASSARLLLIAAEPLEDRPNESFIARHVRAGPPEVQYPVGASYDDRIELIGYDLDLPGGEHVGAGQRFEVTWYWRATAAPPVGYKVFVHIDGFGQRINGDHVPVGGRYPTDYWTEGDVVVDRQELTVPANYGVGDYVMYVGLFKGDKRLPVKSGPNDGADRARAGILAVR